MFGSIYNTEFLMSSSRIKNNSGRFVFESEIKLIDKNLPIFEIKIPENFALHTPDGQQLLIAFMLSTYESIPVMQAELSDGVFPTELIGASIDLVLNQDDNGFSLTIEGDNALLDNPFKKSLALGIYNALIEIDNSYQSAAC